MGMKVAIPKTSNEAQFSLEEDLEKLESLPRDKFMEVYRLVNSMMFEMPSITMEEIEKIRTGQESYFDSKDTRDLISNKTNMTYSDEDSEKFVRKVKASNVTDISDSGYFYKKICNLLDDFYIVEEDCGSDGEEIELSEIDKDYFDYYIKDRYINETGEYYNQFTKFSKKFSSGSKIHLRTPLTCRNANRRCLCRKCVGSTDTGGRSLTSKNIGFITSLAITESATQASLSSMNKGTSVSINKVIEMKLPTFHTWEDAQAKIKEIIDNEIGLGAGRVQSRWFEIALIGRYVFFNNKYVCTSMKTNNNYSEDVFSAYLFNHTEKNLKKVINSENFSLKSIKTKAFFGIYE